MGIKLLALVLLSASFRAQGPPPGTIKIEPIEIDGKTHPELVPQYKVWMNAFRILTGRTRERFPSEIIPVITEEEATYVATEAAGVIKGQEQCWARLAEARKPLEDLEATHPHG